METAEKPSDATLEAPPSETTGENRASGAIFTIGFVFALILAGACLAMAAFYLFSFLQGNQSGIDNLLARAEGGKLASELVQLGINTLMVSSRMALLSCGVFVGMALAFLGFALFLLGVKGEMDLAARSETYGLKIARMSPGAFVILCAALLVAVCATQQTPFRYESRQTSGAADMTRGSDPPGHTTGPGRPVWPDNPIIPDPPDEDANGGLPDKAMDSAAADSR